MIKRGAVIEIIVIFVIVVLASPPPLATRASRLVPPFPLPSKSDTARAATPATITASPDAGAPLTPPLPNPACPLLLVHSLSIFFRSHPSIATTYASRVLLLVAALA